MCSRQGSGLMSVLKCQGSHGTDELITTHWDINKTAFIASGK